MQKIKSLIPVGLMLIPFAAGAENVENVEDIIGVVNSILNKLILLLIGIAVIIFSIGYIKYITAGEDPEKIAAGRNMMIYGIIGLFVMVSVWGLVNVISGTFDVGTGSILQVPGITPDTTGGGTIYR